MKHVWEEKYRPRKFQDVIFSSERDKQFFEKCIKEKQIPNLLFSGIQGTGKTTLSNVLINELGVSKQDVKRINCSDEKIDAIRSKVKEFAYKIPMESPFNIVQLEELDYISLDAQALLRSLIEDVIGNTFFIATANYPNKIMPAIRSRLTQVNFGNPIREVVLLRMAHILEKESIKYEIDVLENIVSAGFPDIRRIIKLLQSCCINGILTNKQEESISDWKLDLLPLIQNNNFSEARKLVCSSASKEELLSLFSFLYYSLESIPKFKDPKKYEMAIRVIAEHEFRISFVADPELQIAAMFGFLMEI